MKLYDLPSGLKPGYRPKIYGLSPNGHENGWVEFDHLDGAYSYCVAYDEEGKWLGVCHPPGWIPLVEYQDGYKVADTDPAKPRSPGQT